MHKSRIKDGHLGVELFHQREANGAHSPVHLLRRLHKYDSPFVVVFRVHIAVAVRISFDPLHVGFLRVVFGYAWSVCERASVVRTLYVLLTHTYIMHQPCSSQSEFQSNLHNLPLPSAAYPPPSLVLPVTVPVPFLISHPASSRLWGGVVLIRNLFLLQVCIQKTKRLLIY